MPTKPTSLLTAGRIYRRLREDSELSCYHSWRVSFGSLDQVMGNICFCRIVDICRSPMMKTYIQAVRAGEFPKELLPSFTPLGLFRTNEQRSKSGRSEDDWVAPSGLVVMDWDYIHPEMYFEEVVQNPYVLAAMRSPRGQGLKIFGTVEWTETPLDTPVAWEQFADLVDQDVSRKLPRSGPKETAKNDRSAGVASQPLFLTYDPELFFDECCLELPAQSPAAGWAPSPLLWTERTRVNDQEILSYLVSRDPSTWKTGPKRRLICPECEYAGGSLRIFIHRDGYWWLKCHFPECEGPNIEETLDQVMELVPEFERLAPRRA